MPGLIYPVPSGPEGLAQTARPTGSREPGPLSIAAYRALWIATTGANIGSCMKDVGAGWLMTSLSASPLIVAMVQAAAMLPMALLSLPGGALADMVDRRTLLLGAQGWALGSALLLFLATLMGQVDAALLLALTFATACGSALSIPALQAVASDMVPRSSVTRAVSLGGLSNNIARIAGPAAGGLLIAAAGTEWVFLANGLSILGIMWVARRWKRDRPSSRLPPEHLLSAIRAGFRYVHSSGELHPLMVRSIAFFLGASALWSLLPLLARQQLGLGPAGYGMLLTSIGTGAIASSLLQHGLRRRFSADELSRGASVLLALAVGAAGWTNSLWLALPAMVAAGFAWNLMTSSLQSTALLGAAGWVKARAFGVFLMVFNASMAAGALIWGTLATRVGVSESMLVAAALLALGLCSSVVYPLIIDPSRDFSPSGHWAEPVVDLEPGPDDGPVLVTVEYEVDPEDNDRFIEQLHRLRALRLRDGAMRWRYWRDVSRRDHFIETFIVESWMEHMRQHERVTRADESVQAQVNAFHLGKDRPLVRHWIAPRN